MSAADSVPKRTPATAHGLAMAAQPTLRGYGLERLEERGELDAARGRHARWAAELVTQAARGLSGAGEAGSVAPGLPHAEAEIAKNCTSRLAKVPRSRPLM